jgi:hypothetical protein
MYSWLNEAYYCNIFISNCCFFPKKSKVTWFFAQFCISLEHLLFCECALGRVLGFFFLQSEVADGFHASIFVIRAVLQCDLNSFVRACVRGSLENQVQGGGCCTLDGVMICASFPTRNMSHFITVMPNGGSRCSSNQVFWESRKLSRIVRHPNQVLAESVILSRIVRHPNQVLAESVMLSRLVMHSNQIILGPMSTNRLCSNNSDEFVRQHFLCRASIRCSLWKSKDGNISSLPFSLLQRIQKRVSIEMCNNHQTKHGELEIAKTKCITVVMIMVIFVANVGGFPNSALAFNWFGQPNEEKDPVEPFTLYGSIL